MTITQILQDSSFIKRIKEVAINESMMEIYMNTYKVKGVWTDKIGTKELTTGIRITAIPMMKI